MLDILTVPNKTLRQVSQPVEKVDKKFVKLVDQIIDTLLKKSDPPGVGLSAIQVGKPTRVFITHLPLDPDLPSGKWSKDNLETIIYINPNITSKSKKLSLGGSFRRPFLEGCLSIPNIYGPAKRHQWVEVEYLTYDPTSSNTPTQFANLKKKTAKLSDFPARVFQHEFDHLEGILFTDYTLKDNQKLYFDEGDELVEVSNPNDLATW